MTVTVSILLFVIGWLVSYLGKPAVVLNLLIRLESPLVSREYSGKNFSRDPSSQTEARIAGAP